MGLQGRFSLKQKKNSNKKNKRGSSTGSLEDALESQGEIAPIDITRQYRQPTDSGSVQTASSKSSKASAKKKSKNRGKSGGLGDLERQLQKFQKEMPTAASEDAKTGADLSIDSFKPVDASVSI